MRKVRKPSSLWKGLIFLFSLLALGLTAGAAFAALPASSSGASSSANTSPARSAPALAATVPQQVRDGSATLVGKHAASDTLVVLFMLPFKDQAGLEAFLADVSNPTSPNYQHYLTLDEENARYNPDVSHEQNVRLVAAKLRSQRCAAGAEPPLRLCQSERRYFQQAPERADQRLRAKRPHLLRAWQHPYAPLKRKR